MPSPAPRERAAPIPAHGRSHALTITLPTVQAFRLDVRDRRAYAQVADDAEALLGPVSILCNNAGVAGAAPVEQLTYDLWDWVMEINVNGVINGMQTFVHRMNGRGGDGHVVNTASGAGLAATLSGAVYTTSKFAVVGLSEAMRMELEPFHVGVSVLCPGPVQTDIIAHTAAQEPPREGITPEEREQQRGRMEGAAAFLAREGARGRRRDGPRRGARQPSLHSHRPDHGRPHRTADAQLARGLAAILSRRRKAGEKRSVAERALLRYIVNMPRLQRKGFGAPDEVRRFPNGVVEIINLDEIAVSRFIFQPGWTWSNDVGPIAGTRSCQHRHVGYTISGRLAVCMDDGTALSIGPGDAYEIPPGHTARVDGEVPWESVEFTSGHAYGKSPGDLGERMLATIVFSDICDSTAMLERMGDAAWTEVVREHNQRIRAVIDRFRGREVATLGTAFSRSSTARPKP